jgi:hypothetical protein
MDRYIYIKIPNLKEQQYAICGAAIYRYYEQFSAKMDTAILTHALLLIVVIFSSYS